MDRSSGVTTTAVGGFNLQRGTFTHARDIEGFPSIDFSTVQKILVGPEKHEFLVAPYFLAKSSSYFSTEIRQQPNRPLKVICLPRTTPEAFETYLRWAYTRQLVLFNEPRQRSTRERPDNHVLDNLIELWVMGMHLMDMFFRDIVIEHIYNRTWCEQITPEILNHVVSVTLDDCALRALCADMFNHNIFQSVSTRPLERLSKESLVVIATRGIYRHQYDAWPGLSKYREPFYEGPAADEGHIIPEF